VLPRKTIITAAIFLIISVVGVTNYYFFSASDEVVTEVDEKAILSEVVIGVSVEGRDIEAYTFGQGDTRLLFVGGVHGGYEWNSTILAYQFVDYFSADSSVLPEGVSVTIIPTLNPDGLYAVTGKEGIFTVDDITVDISDGTGRFNANDVDLNRNFDCKWAPESSWRGKVVSAGTGAFSEPEAAALRDFVVGFDFDTVVFWHSQANTVYASECENGVLPMTSDIMNLYATAAGYRAVESFDAYPITGDAEGWLASIGVPAITVELKTHETIEWEKNLAGVQALLQYMSSR